MPVKFAYIINNYYTMEDLKKNQFGENVDVSEVVAEELQSLEDVTGGAQSMRGNDSTGMPYPW
jgi:hypothetical protein